MVPNYKMRTDVREGNSTVISGSENPAVNLTKNIAAGDNSLSRISSRKKSRESNGSNLNPNFSNGGKLRLKNITGS